MALSRMGIALLSAAWVAGTAAPLASMEGLNVTIVVDDLRSARGRVQIALWAGPGGFPRADDALVEAGQPARRGEVRFTVSGLAPGRYAVASYHDENDNGEFDQTWIGLPDEGLGFSNDAWISLGPPAFDEAAVEIGAKARVIVVRMRY